MDRHRVALTIGSDPVDAHQVAIPLGAYLLANERVRHRVEGAVDLDVSIRMHRPRANLEQPERLAGQRLQRWLIDLQEMAQHLLTRGPVDADLSHRAVPALEVLGQRLQAVEAAAFQRVGFHVPATSFGDPVFLWVAGP